MKLYQEVYIEMPEISTEQSVTYEENRKTLSIGDILRTMTGN